MKPLFTLKTRSAGILLHPTSLPGPYGCGDLGPQAYRFVDWLHAAGMRWWQMLPITPVGNDGAPYSSYSAFAGGAHLVSLDALVADGLLKRAERIDPPAGLARGSTKWPATMKYRNDRLRLAFERFAVGGRAAMKLHRAYERFRRSQPWLTDFARFCALRECFDQRPWTDWPVEFRDRKPHALADTDRELECEISYECFVQFLFERQWNALQDYAAAKGVALLGDIPIFIAHDSSDVWANRELFQLHRDGRPRVVSGCPPDSFSATGQLWGHPLYDWPRHQRTGFRWWMDRFRRTLGQFRAVRIDHFLGFHQCWAVPGGDKTALHGRYQRTPGRPFFAALGKALRAPQIVAEDLGAVTPQALNLRDEFGFPGMRILQNAFWEGARFDQPHNYPPNSVVYTGTHDNDTIAGWWNRVAVDRKRGRDQLTTRERTLRYLACAPREVVREMVRATLAAPSNTAIIPLQDVLGLDNRARMNLPATVGPQNWTWRMPVGALHEKNARELRSWVEAYERD